MIESPEGYEDIKQKIGVSGLTQFTATEEMALAIYHAGMKAQAEKDAQIAMGHSGPRMCECVGLSIARAIRKAVDKT